ncbi:MAG: hypothetical protein FWD17_06670 [Polyangiaceae bacterium]|nr:hypothetical protein [Polyangiaceae bacterium]
MGLPFASATGAQQLVVNPAWPELLHSPLVLQRHCCPVTLPGAMQAPPLPPGSGVQHPSAGGQALLVVHDVAQDLFPAGSV